MKSIILVAGALSVFVIQGCSNNESKNEDGTTQSPMQTENANFDSTQAVTASDAMPRGTTSAPVVSGSSAPNPPHGEPGHRCDIDVGAPLNSPPGAKPAPLGEITEQPATPSPASPTPNFNVGQTQSIQVSPPGGQKAPGTPTAPGMNPPHGEPGHECGIPVGAPLKK